MRRLSDMIGKQVSRDTIGYLRQLEFIAAGPRSPQVGAPYTYVTTKGFLAHFDLDTLRDLPDIEALEDAGLLNEEARRAGGFLSIPTEDEDAEADELDDPGDDDADR